MTPPQPLNGTYTNSDDRLARELLMAHAEALRLGFETTRIMTRRYPQLASLLQLAENLYHAFEMVAVGDEFENRLYDELMQAQLDAPRARTRMIIGVAAVGSALTGLAAWSIHRLLLTREPAALAANSGVNTA